MPAAAVVTVVLAGIALVAIAGYLVRIALHLRRVSSSLQTVLGAVAAMPEKTAPIEPVVGSIKQDLGAARGILQDLLASKLGAPVDAPSRTRHEQAVPPVSAAPLTHHEHAAEPETAAPPASERIKWRVRH